VQSPVLLAYANCFSVAPSETLRVMVSAATATYRARLVRLVHGDTNPAGPGYREVAVPSAADGAYPGRQQTSTAGSCVRVPLRTPLDPSDGLTVQAWVWPTTPDKPGGQSLLACAASGFDFGLDDEGRLRLGLGGVWVGATEPLPRRRWAFVAVTFDGATATLHQASAEPYTARTLVVSEAPLHGAAHLAEELVIGRGFNGKIDRPRLFGRALSDAEMEGLAGDGAVPRDALADWDFAADISSMRVTDHSPNSLHGETFNMPTRAVTDHTWRGDELRWTAASDQYSAIHFHDDDIDDARWAPDFELTIPPDLRSGVYAMKLEADGGEEYVPFYVRPKRGTASAPMAFLAPTLTYLAYANERLYWNKGYLEKRSLVTPLETEPPDLDRYMNEHRELGLSLYDSHSDGSGVSYSSRLRPILNMRPKYRAWRLHDAPRHFAADLYLVGWLERHFPDGFDVITDEDLHAEGADLLARYRVVLTGSHPEYYTSAMLGGLTGYLERGGRLMYLGGNGFYWVTSVDPRRPHAIELRRGVAGTRAWESLPGEYYHSTTGEPGGLWRLRGRGPQRTVGVGFAAQGWGGACGYRRLPASFDPRVAFVFEGIGDDEVIGDFGFVLGGAAGDEIDRFDLDLGSPAHGLVLATSAGQHTDYYQVTTEDVPIMVPGQGGTQSPRVRADMVFFETTGGGAVFSVGSINWIGSLGWNADQNSVAQITGNVLRRFLDPAPFTRP
jgi:N,N-dimethylformamidase